MIKIGLLLVLVTSPLTYLAYKNHSKRVEIDDRREAYEKSLRLTDADRTELTAAIARARKAIEDAARTFVNAVTPQKLEALQDAGTRCPYRVSAPSMGAGESYIKYGSIDMSYFGNASYRLFAPGEPVTPQIAMQLAMLGDISKELAEKKADKNDLDRVHRMERYAEDDLFVVGTKTEAIVLADSYEPGTLTGFAYLYSYDAQRVVCFTALAVQNRPSIEFEYRTATPGSPIDYNKDAAARAVLTRDLEVEIRTAIAARLQAAL